MHGMAQSVDFTKPFLPERLTPLYHTPLYAQLLTRQRLRYNQLHAAYFNEQTIFFESVMAQHLLRGLIKHRGLPDKLATGLRSFITEEAEHSQMFRALNRLCWPERYINSDFHFIRLPPWTSICLRQAVARPRWFPFFLWVLLIQEERALFCAKEFLDQSNNLEPNFVATQRRHLADEIGHIHWDEELLDWLWPNIAKWRRKMNARFFAWMMREYFTTPKRSGLRVVAELVYEFPELTILWPNLRKQMLALSEHREFNLLCYSRAVTPKTFSRFDRWPEFNSPGKALLGYEPASAPSARSQSIQI